MADQDLGDFVDRYHAALDRFSCRNPEPAKRLYSRRDGVSLGNPFARSSWPVLLLEEGEWRLVQRHAGPITSPRAPGLLIER
jgi:hypothetical protein